MLSARLALFAGERYKRDTQLEIVAHRPRSGAVPVAWLECGGEYETLVELRLRLRREQRTVTSSHHGILAGLLCPRKLDEKRLGKFVKPVLGDVRFGLVHVEMCVT